MGIIQNPFVRLALCWGAVLLAAYLVSAVYVTHHFTTKGRVSTPASTTHQYESRAAASPYNGPYYQVAPNFEGTRFENCDLDSNNLPILLPQSLILWLTAAFGCLGVGRFTSGYVCFGVLQLLSCGCLGLW